MELSTLVPIGQYLPGNSFLHRVDPRSKILFIFFYVLFLFSATNNWLMVAYSLLSLLAALSSGIPLSYQWKVYRGLLLMILLFGLFQSVYIREGVPVASLFGLPIYDRGIIEAGLTAMKLTALLIMTSLITFTSTAMALTEALERLLSPFSRMGLPVGEISLMMTIAIRYIPTLVEEMEKIMKAQMARGADFESRNFKKRIAAIFPLIVPLFVNSFRRAEELALSMEARGYRGGEGRTRRYKLSFTYRDGILLLLLIMMGVAFLYERMWLR